MDWDMFKGMKTVLCQSLTYVQNAMRVLTSLQSGWLLNASDLLVSEFKRNAQTVFPTADCFN